jgi:hypothetical protein
MAQVATQKNNSPPTYMSKPKKEQDSFPFVTQAELREKSFRLTKHQSSALRAKLTMGIYWIKPLDRAILWNERLIVDLLINGDRPEHQAMVDRYIDSLPKSA